jgi:hypothetical protein
MSFLHNYNWVTWREWRIGCPKKDLHSRTGRDKTKRKTQERIERSRKRSSSARNEKMEKNGDR